MKRGKGTYHTQSLTQGGGGVPRELQAAPEHTLSQPGRGEWGLRMEQDALYLRGRKVPKPRIRY